MLVTAECTKKFRRIDDIILIEQDVPCLGGSDTRHIEFIESFLKDSRRGIAGREKSVNDSTGNRFKLAINVVKLIFQFNLCRVACSSTILCYQL